MQDLLNRLRYKTLVVFILMFFLSSQNMRSLAQTNSLTGTIDASSPCFLHSSSASFPYNSVRFQVPTAGSYSFSVSAKTITNTLWFYLYAGSHNPTQPHDQPSLIGFASSEGYNGGVITANLSPGITYIMASNNDQLFATPLDCESRSTTVSGNYTIASSAPILILPRTLPGPQEEGEEGIVMPPDNRINWQYGDLYAVLYRGENELGEAAINVYCWNGTTASLGMQVSAANATDTMQALGCEVILYIIDNEHYQFNINFETKRYEIECVDFECTIPEMRYFDPNE